MSLRPFSPRLRRVLWTVLSVVVVFTIGGFLILPPIVKTQIEQRLGSELGRVVTLGPVRVNPYALSVTLENFSVREADAAANFVSWRRLHVNFEALASLGGEWVLGEVELDGLQAAVQLRPDGSLNFSDILAKLAARPAAPAAPPGRALAVNRLNVTQARVDFTDRSQPQPFATTIGPLTFSVTDFQTAGARGAPYRFAAETEAGEKIAWSGTMHASPFRSAGELRLENIPIAKYAPYHAPHLTADVTDGKLTLRGRYEINLAAGARVLRLLDGVVQLRELKVLDRTSRDPIFDLPALDVTGIHADAIAAKVEIAAIALADGHLRARRTKDGTIDLLLLIAPAAHPAPTPTSVSAPPAPSPARPPVLTVGELSLKNFKVDWTDLATPRPSQLSLADIQFTLQSLSLADGAVMPLQLAFEWAPRGTVRLGGTVALKPQIQATLQADITELDLLPFGPYLEHFVNARLTQGTFSTRHQLRVALKGDSPEVSLEGALQLANFGLVDNARNEDLAGFASLTLSGIKAATIPQVTLAVAELRVAGPFARAIVKEDKSVNFSTLAPPPASVSAAKPPAAGAPAAAPLPRITLGQIVVTGGDFSFEDRSVQPHVRTSLGQFGGTIGGLASENMARADVALKGVVDGAGPVAITGRLDPLGARKFVDLTVDFKNVDLVPFSPYSGKFAGFELARGKLVVDTHFVLDDTRIDATNVVTLERLTFGAPVASPDATQLPVRLGVALLKDLDGRIVIDLPVQGNLNDPEFKIGRVVGRVLLNLLTKAAVSPFKLLGSMFGGGGDELAFQEFAAGSNALRPTEVGKLDTMIKALTNRPGLSLALEGSFDPAADAHALKRVKLADRVRRSIWEARRTSEPNLPPPEKLVLTPAEEAAMIKRLFDQHFPPGTEFGTPLPPPPTVVRPPETPRSFFQRLVRTVTGQAKRELAAANAENERLAAEHQQALAAALAGGRPVAEMVGRLAETIEITSADLAALSADRARQVRDYFISKGQIAADRLFLSQATESSPGTKGPRVFLSLQ